MFKWIYFCHSLSDALGDGLGDGFCDIRGDGPGEHVTNGDNVRSWFGENLEILWFSFGDNFGDAFVERRIWAIWPILDDGLLKVCKVITSKVWLQFKIRYVSFCDGSYTSLKLDITYVTINIIWI